MTFCVHCGKRLPDDARFCNGCGKSVEQVETNEGKARETKYEGTVHKCPQCGEALHSFVSVCPACGHEMRDTIVTKAVREFFSKLEIIGSKEQKIAFISAFPVPNNKEDILEFMSLASSNFDAYYYAAHLDEEDMSDAWLAKIEQCYQKAKISFGNDADFGEILIRYEEAHRKLENSIADYNKMQKEEREHNRKTEIKVRLAEEAEKFKKGKTIKFLIAIATIVVLMGTIAFATKNFLSGVFSALMLLCVVGALLVGLNIISVPSAGMRLLVILLAFLLCLPFLVVYFSSLNRSEPEAYFEWKNIVLGEALPEPPTNQGEVHTNSDDYLSFELHGMSESDYIKYKNACISFGYSLRSNTYSGHYEASNSDRYRVSISYNESEEIISVILDLPLPVELLNLTNLKLISLLPSLDVSYGRITENTEQKLDFCVVNIEMDGFKNYIEACRDMGYKADVKESTYQYCARNNENYKLELNYYEPDAELTIKLYYDPPIVIGLNAKNLKGENYEDIQLILKNKGFTNIETKEKADLINGWLTPENSIESISINGNTSFGENDEFFSDAKIVITYHTFKD